MEGERPEPADVADPDTETPKNRPGVSEEEDGFANDAEEEMEDLPMEEKGKDPLLYATVKVCIGGKEHIAKVNAAISCGKTCVALDWALGQLNRHDQPPAMSIRSKMSTQKATQPAAIMDHFVEIQHPGKGKGE